MRDGCLGTTTAVVGMALLLAVLVVAIGSIGSSPNVGPNGLTWDHTGRIAYEENRTERYIYQQGQETQRAEEWNETMRWGVVALVVFGGIWIFSREMGTTVRNGQNNRAKVAMYQIYMRQQYPNARIESHDGMQLVVDPDTQTVFPLAVLRAEARAAGYDEM